LPGNDFYKQLSNYYPSPAFWGDITWSLLKLTQINLPKPIQLPGNDFYKQLSTIYPSSVFLWGTFHGTYEN